MKKIFKYVLSPNKVQVVDLPKDAEILNVHNQSDHLCIWALVDPDAPSEPRTLHIIQTGQAFDHTENMIYIGTGHLFHGTLVLHVFEVV